MSQFETVGYVVDYYIGNKYQGHISIPEPDRAITGYEGRKRATLNEPVTLTKGTKLNTLKKGSHVVTELIPINGRIKLQC